MSTPTFTIQSVHGIKQTFVLGPTVQVPENGQTENKQQSGTANSAPNDHSDKAPQNPR